MTRQLAEQRILITGASRGIGRWVAEKAVKRGARVLLAARSAGPLEELVLSLTANGGEAFAVAADITREEDRQRIHEAVLDRFGGLDILINNAGVASFGHFADSSEAILRQVMEVNFFTPAELIRLFAPLLAQGRKPAVVNIASICGRLGLPAWSEHSASKYALCGLTEALRGEMARFNIDVLLVLPGLVQSDPARHLLRNAGRMKFDYANATPPEEVADAVMRTLERNTTETIVGRDACRLLLFKRFFPRLLSWLIARRVRKLYA